LPDGVFFPVFFPDGVPSPVFPPVTSITLLSWVCGLGTSLSSAVLSTLLQTWLRRYIVLTRPQQNPRALALIRAYVIIRRSLNSLQFMVDVLHLLLDFAIFSFLFGLLVFLGDFNCLVAVFTMFIIVLFLYLALSFISYDSRYTIYSTPLSRVMFHSRYILKLILRSLDCTKSRIKPPLRRGFEVNAILGLDWLALDSIDHVAEKLVETDPLSLNTEVVTRLLRSLHCGQDFERFLESIAGFYDSGLVKQPNQVFRRFHEDRVPRAILSFMRHTLSSSATLTNDIKQKRIKLSLEVIELDPYLRERTFFHALSLFPTKPTPTIFQCVDFILFADRFAGNANENQDARLLAMCIVAIAISHLTARELDERWPPIVERLLNFRLSDATLGRQLASMKLLNLVRLAEELKSPSVEFKNEILRKALRTVGDFQVEGVSPESRNKFCNLWNQLRDSAASTGYPGTNEDFILLEIRAIYNALHGGADDPLTNPDLAVANYYPRCIDPTHLTSNPTASVSPNVAQASGEAPTITTPQASGLRT
jgi:hypothetical protein